MKWNGQKVIEWIWDIWQETWNKGKISQDWTYNLLFLMYKKGK